MLNYDTPESQIRLIIGDLDENNRLFGDAELTGFLGIARNSVKRAAAEALDTIASSEALLSKKITTQDRSADGPAVADALRKHADALRKRAREEEDEADEEPFFDAFNILPGRSNEGEEAKLR